jgi:small-conductance mechanosensitive channel
MREDLENRVLDTLVANTQALASLNATLNTIQQTMAESQRSLREQHNTVLARIENMDRSLSESTLTQEKTDDLRKVEYGRVYDLLLEERKDRRETHEGEKKALVSDRDYVRSLIAEELSAKKLAKSNQSQWITSVAKEVWAAGGKWIVVAVFLLVVSALLKASGLTIADLIGLSGK